MTTPGGGGQCKSRQHLPPLLESHMMQVTLKIFNVMILRVRRCTPDASLRRGQTCVDPHTRIDLVAVLVLRRAVRQVSQDRHLSEPSKRPSWFKMQVTSQPGSRSAVFRTPTAPKLRCVPVPSSSSLHRVASICHSSADASEASTSGEHRQQQHPSNPHPFPNITASPSPAQSPAQSA